MSEKHVTYNHAFGNEHGIEVLEDLSEFCFFEKSYIDTAKKLTTSEDGRRIVGVSQIDPLELARFEGRREVYLFIKNMMKKQPEDQETIDYDEYP